MKQNERPLFFSANMFVSGTEPGFFTWKKRFDFYSDLKVR